MQTAIMLALLGLTLVNAQIPPVLGITGQLRDATISKGNPAGVIYIAISPGWNITNVSLIKQIQLLTEY